MGRSGKLFQIKDHQRRVGDGLPEDRLGVFAKRIVQLFLCAVRIHKGGFHAHLLKGMGVKVVGAAVKRGGTDDVIPRLGKVHDGIKACRLPGGCQHGRRSPFQVADLRRHGIIGGILETGIKIAGLLQVK